MKRFLCTLLIMCTICACSFADSVDLSAYTFDELKALQEAISAEIVTRPEWKETKIPSGQWVVGTDIPVGEYRITIPEGSAAHLNIIDPSERKTKQTVIDWFAFNDTDFLGKMILKEGYIITLSAGSVIFSPVLPLGF